MEVRGCALENLVSSNFWRGKRVCITGHTGFKGSWLCLWLHMLGADVLGYSNGPVTQPNLFELLSLGDSVTNINGDILDYIHFSKIIAEFSPQIVIHMAAQSLVREGYRSPLQTYAVNCMGTANVLEACRYVDGLQVILIVTSDKCYENREWVWGYRENEPLGGIDPYSSSKACSELITQSYRESFFSRKNDDEHGVAIATVRAGNVIGGGDWSEDRLVPDCIRAFMNKEQIVIRNPYAIRPWQYVLDPLHGYLMLIERLFVDGPKFNGSWNFGPDEDDAQEVRWIVEKFCDTMNHTPWYAISGDEHPREALFLKLDCAKAKSLLKWKPKMKLSESIDEIVYWAKSYLTGKDTRHISIEQINRFISKKGHA